LCATMRPALLTARASYTHLSQQRVVDSREAALVLPWAAASSSAVPPPPHIEVDVARCRSLAASTLQQAVHLHDKGEFTQAAALLRSTTDALLESAAVAHPVVVGLVDELEALKGASATSEGLNRGSRAAALSAISAHATQRFAGGTAALSASAYQVASQAHMLLAARRCRGGAGAPHASFASGGWGDLRARSNFDRAMAAEARLEPQGSSASVLVTGAITTAWAAVQLTEDGVYTLSVRRLGILADSALLPRTVEPPPKWGVAEVAATRDPAVINAGSVSAEGHGLVPGLRVTTGSILFGGAPGILLLHGRNAESKPSPLAAIGTASTSQALTLDLDASICLTLTTALVVVESRGSDGTTRHIAELPRQQQSASATGIASPVILGLENVAVLVTKTS
jgi:hypothetical protein